MSAAVSRVGGAGAVVVWTIVVAAGQGSRFGRAKQFAVLGGRPVLDWALATARDASAGVVLVLPPTDATGMGALGGGTWGADVVVPGGATRSASVRAGLAAVPGQADVVVVHDAARPLAGPVVFAAVVGAVAAGADGAVPGIPLSDTVKRVVVVPGGERVVVDTVDRHDLVAVQTPQAFRADALRRAHAGGAEATDDAALVEAGGGRVVVVDGDPRNVKVTHPQDLVVASALLRGD